MESHQRHCAVSLGNRLYPLLSDGSNQETDRKIVGHKICVRSNKCRVPTVREKSGKKLKKNPRSGISQGILSLVREIRNFCKSQGKVREL